MDLALETFFPSYPRLDQIKRAYDVAELNEFAQNVNLCCPRPTVVDFSAWVDNAAQARDTRQFYEGEP